MSEQLDAKLRIVIKPDLRELEKAEKELGKGEPREGARGPGRRLPPGVIPGSTKIGPDTWRAPNGVVYGRRAKDLRAPRRGLGSRVASMAGIALTATAAIEAAEYVGPALGTVGVEMARKLPPVLREVPLAIAKLNKKLADEVSKLISGAKAELKAVFGTVSASAEAARAFAVLRGDASQVNPGDVYEMAKRLHGHMRMQELANRRREVVTRDAFVYTLSRMVLDKVVP